MVNEKVKIIEVEDKKPKPDPNGLMFGRHFTDYMFTMDYSTELGWHEARIVPYEAITLDPASMIFHYGQTVFEGLKAYRTEDERVLLFRPDKNIERLNQSSERLSIPKVDNEQVLDYLLQFISLEKDWVPSSEGTSLYIRPFIIATEPHLGLSPSSTYKLIVILSPVGSYYPEGINPVSIFVEESYVRAVKGGTGTAKTAGNYSASYIAQKKASNNGFSQVLWLDALEKRYVEEVGSMNVFFKINGEIITPALNGSILEGITRMSAIELMKEWGLTVTERRITIEEVVKAAKTGELEEIFGTGTAAVISPVGLLQWKDESITINHRQTGPLAKKLYDTLTGIQTGKLPDPFGWTVVVK